MFADKIFRKASCDIALLLMLVATLSVSCQNKKTSNASTAEHLSCSVTDSMLGKEYLDATFIKAIDAIKTSTGKELILKSIKHCHAEFLTFLYAP